MILSRDLKKTRPEKPKPFSMIDTSKNVVEVDRILKKKFPEPPGYVRTPPLKKPLTLQDAEKKPEVEEIDPLRSIVSNELNEVNTDESPQETPIEVPEEKPAEVEVPVEEIPWTNPEGEFMKLPLADYRALDSAQKKAYSEAKKEAGE